MDDREQQQELPIEPDYSGESLEDLESRLMAGEGLVVERDDVDPEPEPEEQPEVADEEQEPVEQEAAAEEAPEEQAEVPEELEFDEQASLIEEMKLEVERFRAQSERDRVLQQRDSGRVGALNLEIRRLREAIQQRPQQQQQADDSYEDYQPQYAPQPQQSPGADPEHQSRLVALEQEARARAVLEVGQEFIQGHGLSQEEGQALIAELGPALQEQAKPYADEFQNMQPGSMKKVLGVMLNSAYADHKLSQIKDQRRQALERKAQQVPERKKAKTASAVSGSGSTSAPKARPKAPEQMTAEEADKALIAEFGDGHYRRKRG